MNHNPLHRPAPPSDRIAFRLGVWAAAVALVLALGQRTTHASVIYSNLGVGDTFNVSPGTYPVWNLSSSGYIHRAAAFTVPAGPNVMFGSAELGFYLNSGTASANVQLAANAVGNIPGATIESINITLPAVSSTPKIVKATSVKCPVLTAGATYWIIASVNVAPTMATWGANNTGASGGNATRTNFMSGKWFLQGQNGIASLRVNSKVPEPAALCLAALGLALLPLPTGREPG